MSLLARLPLTWLRAMGWVLGRVLFHTSARRGHVVATNIALCFPHLDAHQQRALAKKHFVLVAQSLLDRAWLWHASEEVLYRRLQCTGELQHLQDSSPLILLAPHFVGLDAGGVALTVLHQVRMACIYVPLTNRLTEDWMMQGRNRSGRLWSVARKEGPQPLMKALRDGQRLHFSPDMDFGMEGAVWSSFFGVPTATLSSLSRFAKLGRARVCTVVTRLTPQGYCLEIGPVWTEFPSMDLDADTLRMNQDIEAWVRQCPEQYYWVHKRFKTRPPGQPSVYASTKNA